MKTSGRKRARAQDYFAAADRGDLQAIYRFGEVLLQEEDLIFSADGLQIKGFEHGVKLNSAEGFEDWLKP